MIGDGATDLQAKPPADLFIGYGGVVAREAVKQGADLFVTDLLVGRLQTLICSFLLNSPLELLLLQDIVTLLDA